LCGDFNYDLLVCDSDTDSRFFLNSMSTLSLVPLISRPTRITDNSATLIDNILLANPSNFEAGTVISDVSDHFPIFVIIRSVYSAPFNNK